MSLAARDLDRYLSALGDEMQGAGVEARLIVVGGAALVLRGTVQRLTGDVDVLAEVREDALVLPRPFTPALRTAIERVAASFPAALESQWVNAAVATSWQNARWPDDLPPGLDDVEWRDYGPLAVGLAGRRTLIPMKVHALMDRSTQPTFNREMRVTGATVEPTGYDRRHLTDLLALRPTDEELEEAAAWVRSQDQGDIGPLVDAVIERIRADR